MKDVNSPLSDIEFVAFDLETTGLFPVSCRIVEFGAVRFRLAGKEQGQFQQIVDPECRVPQDATRIHGITNAMVKGQPTVSETLPSFFDFLSGPKTLLLAHNATFDLGFLGFAAARMDVEFPVNPVIDTLALARRCVRGIKSYRLEKLAIHLGLADSEDHRALSDAQLAMALLRKIIKLNRGLQTVEDLFDLSRPLGIQDGGVFSIQPPVGYEDLGTAIEEDLSVVILYEGGTKGATQRKVTPRALLQSRGHLYLAAYCHIDGIEKTYRVDRISELRIEGK